MFGLSLLLIKKQMAQLHLKRVVEKERGGSRRTVRACKRRGVVQSDIQNHLNFASVTI